ncbi:unnamed protein product (macronuclear) [Paramecium tetraurelia]|uniref:Uncharacterized protein n=1 Tax=Paramecium tetraurelia TaxID=5888 RepID=A0DM07_PARTE|nr:uncharacterized protein GSPATT00018292001 [Paramecium tetraurelia]CAK84074.1 unnamed protein product [Paramecium tetraurelia]|eukprot:XP_001451471.1 hypothetical protein (macronuclear) [Paramecium tetraurelia strain d4-2]
MARIKSGKQQQKQPPQQTYQQQQPAQQQPIQKNIKKIKQAPSEERIIERKPSPQQLLEKRTRREQQQQSVKKKIRQPYNQGFYPEVPNLQFPNQLLDCLVKVICSFGNSAKLTQIIKNLSLFYTNEVQEEVVNLVLAESEESGAIYELEAKFKVTNALIQKPLLQKNDQLGSKMKHEDIDDNDQFHSLSNNHAQCIYPIQILRGSGNRR